MLEGPLARGAFSIKPCRRREGGRALAAVLPFLFFFTFSALQSSTVQFKGCDRSNFHFGGIKPGESPGAYKPNLKILSLGGARLHEAPSAKV